MKVNDNNRLTVRVIEDYLIHSNDPLVAREEALSDMGRLLAEEIVKARTSDIRCFPDSLTGDSILEMSVYVFSGEQLKEFVNRCIAVDRQRRGR